MIYISKYPIEIRYNKNNETITKFIENDKEELKNYNDFDRRLLFIPYILLYDFDRFCVTHPPTYFYEKNGENELYKKVDCMCMKKIHLWSKDDLHLRIGKEIAEITTRSLNLLRRNKLYINNNANHTRIFKDYDDFLKYTPEKRLNLIGDVLCNIISICKKFPYHIFGIYDNDNGNIKKIDKTQFLIYDTKHYAISNTKEKMDKQLNCSNCQKGGHTIGYCYKMNYQCYTCKAFGHVSLECKIK